MKVLDWRVELDRRAMSVNDWGPKDQMFEVFQIFRHLSLDEGLELAVREDWDLWRRW